MSTTLALPKLFDDVSALMLSWAAVVSALAWVTWSGTSIPSITGSPAAAGEIRVRFPTGGTIGVAGIFYQVSVDDGSTWGTLAALGTATSISILGISLALAAGTIADGDVVRWTQTAPDVTPHRFGWRERSKHEGARRIVWEPGDDGDVGELVAARNPGRNPRPLWTLDELVTVYLEAVDQTDAATSENERAQYVAARLLFDLWARAVYQVAHGTIEIRKIGWLDTQNIRRYGATLRVVLSVQAEIPDALQTTASTNTIADVHTTIVIEDDASDQTDTETVSPTDTP